MKFYIVYLAPRFLQQECGSGVVWAGGRWRLFRGLTGLSGLQILRVGVEGERKYRCREQLACRRGRTRLSWAGGETHTPFPATLGMGMAAIGRGENGPVWDPWSLRCPGAWRPSLEPLFLAFDSTLARRQCIWAER